MINADNIKNILLALIGSLASFLFYGYIETKDKLDTVETRLVQVESELNDIWAKYNKEQDSKMDFIREFYKELDKKMDK